MPPKSYVMLAFAGPVFALVFGALLMVTALLFVFFDIASGVSAGEIVVRKAITLRDVSLVVVVFLVGGALFGWGAWAFHGTAPKPFDRNYYLFTPPASTTRATRRQQRR